MRGANYKKMKKTFLSILSFMILSHVSCNGAVDVSIKIKRTQQIAQLRSLCREAQELEGEISKLECEQENLEKKEKTSTPVIKNILEILARCFTVLFDIQRFSPMLVISQAENKNDFVRCSVIIKNFAPYFSRVNSQLNKGTLEIKKMKTTMLECKQNLNALKEKYQKASEIVFAKASEISKNNDETIIQNIVYHIATKSTSIEELDAELESENAIGVLKNTKVTTDLVLSYPVKGRIVSEFGDKGKNGEMLLYTGFSCAPHAIVTSPAKGLVVFSGNFLNYGNMVIISNGDYRVFLYGMESVFAVAGDTVEIGDYIGKMGTALKKEGTAVIKMELRKSGDALDLRHLIQQKEPEKGKE